MFLYESIKKGLAGLRSPAPFIRQGSRQIVLTREPIFNPDRDAVFAQEQMRVYAGIHRVRHNIFSDNWTGENPTMRLAYRKALAEPTVKAALLEKIISVCRLTPQLTPANKRNRRDHDIAAFCHHAITKSRGGMAAVLWGICSGGLIDGWSLGEKVFQIEERGQYRGMRTLYMVKAKDTRYLQVEIDPFRNILGYYSVRGNQARRFAPDNYIHFSYLSLFESPTGMSDLRASFRAIEFLPAVILMRTIFLEKFCGPFLKGTLSNTALREKMGEQLAQGRAKGYIVLDKGSDIEVLDLATRGTSDFQAAIEHLEREAVTGIAGAYLHMMTGSTPDARGNSEVQQGTVDSFVWWLAELASQAIQTYLIPDLVDPNFGSQTDLPNFSLQAVDPAAIQADLGIDKILNEMGVDLDIDDIYDRSRRSPPRDPASTLKGRTQSAGGFDPSGNGAAPITGPGPLAAFEPM